MRLRGATKSELDELGIDTEGMQDARKSVVKMFKSMAGIDIMEGTNYKSTFQILDELHDKWESLSDAEHAALTEAIAGKRGGTVMASLMQNWEDAREVIEKTTNVEQTAKERSELIMQSAQAKLNVLKANAQEFSYDLINSDMLKAGIDGLNTFLSLLTRVTSATKGVAPVFAALGGGLYIFNSFTGAFDKLIKALKGIKLNADLAWGAAEGLASALGMVAATYAVMQFTDIVNAEKDFQQAAKGAADRYEAASESIDGYKEKIASLQLVINDSSSSYEDVANARTELMGVQKDLIEQFGSEATAVDTVTKAINGQVEALDKLKEAEYRKELNELNSVQFNVLDPSTYMNFPKEYAKALNNALSQTYYADTSGKYLVDFAPLGEVFSEVEKSLAGEGITAEEALQNHIERHPIELKFTVDDADIAKQISEMYGYELHLEDDGGGILKTRGEVRDLQKDLDKIQSSNFDISSKFERSIATNAADIRKIIDSEASLYDQHTLYDVIKQDDSMSQIYDEYQKDFAEYKKAVADNNKDLADEYADSMYQIVTDLEKSGVDKRIVKYFDNVVPEMESEYKNRSVMAALLVPNEKEIQAAKENLRDEVKKIYDWGLSDRADEIINGNIKSQYGNVDMDNRNVIHWTLDNVNKFKDQLKDIKWYDEDGNFIESYYDQLLQSAKDGEDSIDTVFGDIMEQIEGYGDITDIAFSHLVVDGDQSYFLGQQTAREYIYGILDQAKKDNDLSIGHILELDKRGIKNAAVYNEQGQQVAEQYIHGIIAGFNEQALDISELMHFSGDFGAWKLGQDWLDSAKGQLTDEAEEMLQILKSFENLDQFKNFDRDTIYAGESAGLNNLKDGYDALEKYAHRLGVEVDDLIAGFERLGKLGNLWVDSNRDKVTGDINRAYWSTDAYEYMSSDEIEQNETNLGFAIDKRLSAEEYEQLVNIEGVYDLIVGKARELQIETGNQITGVSEYEDIMREILHMSSQFADGDYFSQFDGTLLGQRLDMMGDQLEEGKITVSQYFKDLENELNNFDASGFTDSIDEANAAAQTFFTDGVVRLSDGFNDLITGFDNGSIAAADYLEGYASMATTLSAFTDYLQENSAAFNENGEAIESGTSAALDAAQDKIASGIETINQYKDSVAALGDLSELDINSEEYSNAVNVVAEDLQYIVNNSGAMADQIKSNFGSTTEEIAKSLTGSVSNQALAAQAIAQNTNTSIADMADAVGTIFDELGNAISNFKADIEFSVGPMQNIDLFGGSLGGKLNGLLNLQMPQKISISGSSQSLAAVGAAVKKIGNAIKSSIMSQTMSAEDIMKPLTGSDSKGAKDRWKTPKDTGKGGGGGGGGGKSDAEKETDILKELSSQLDEIQAAYSSLNEIVEAYNENGKLTIDQAQQLINTDFRYLAMLTDENGQLRLNEQGFRDLAQAKLQEMQIQLAKNAIDTVNGLQSEADAVNFLTYAYEGLKGAALGATEAMLQSAVAAAHARGIKQGEAADKILAGYNATKQAIGNVDLSSGSLAGKKDEGKDKADKDKKSEEKEQQDTKTKFNWLDILVEKIQRSIDQLAKKADKYFNYMKKNAFVDKQIDENRKMIATQEFAVDFYRNKTSKALKKVPKKYRNLVSGNFDPETVKKLIVELGSSKTQKIQDYLEWQELLDKSQDTLEEAYEQERSLIASKLDNILDYFDTLIGYQQNIVDKIQSAAALRSAKGETPDINQTLAAYAANKNIVDNYGVNREAYEKAAKDTYDAIEESYEKQYENTATNYQNTTEYQKLKDKKKKQKAIKDSLNTDYQVLAEDVNAFISAKKTYDKGINKKTTSKAYKKAEEAKKIMDELHAKYTEALEEIRELEAEELQQAAATSQDQLIQLETSKNQAEAEMIGTIWEVLSNMSDVYDRQISQLSAIISRYTTIADLLKEIDEEKVRDYGVSDIFGVDLLGTGTRTNALAQAIANTKDVIKEYHDQYYLYEKLIEAAESDAAIRQQKFAEILNTPDLNDDSKRIVQDIINELANNTDWNNNTHLIEWKDTLSSIVSAIADAMKQAEDYGDDLADSVKQATQRIIDSLQLLQEAYASKAGLISDDWATDINGLTDYGYAKISALSQEIDIARKRADLYRQQISDIMANRENYATEEDYNEAYNGAVRDYYGALKDAYDVQNQVYELAKKVAATEVDNLSKLVENYKKALNAKKSYYDYDKQLKEKNKNIQSLEAQMKALENVGDAASKARLKALESELKEAQEDLDDTVFNHQVEVETNALDQLVQDMTDALNDTAKTIEKTFEDFSKTVAATMEAAAGVDTGAIYEKLIDFIMHGSVSSGNYNNGIDTTGGNISGTVSSTGTSASNAITTSSSVAEDIANGEIVSINQNDTIANINTNVLAVLNQADKIREFTKSISENYVMLGMKNDISTISSDVKSIVGNTSKISGQLDTIQGLMKNNNEQYTNLIIKGNYLYDGLKRIGKVVVYH